MGSPTKNNVSTVSPKSLSPPNKVLVIELVIVLVIELVIEPARRSAEGRPLHEDAGLHGVHDAPEARLLLRAPQNQPHLPREGGGQPITHLRRHRVRPDVAQLVLRVHQPPARGEGGEREGERERETGGGQVRGVDRWMDRR